MKRTFGLLLMLLLSVLLSGCGGSDNASPVKENSEISEDCIDQDCDGSDSVVTNEDLYQIDYGYIQTRTIYGSMENFYRGCLNFSKTDEPIEESDITGITLKTSSGSDIPVIPVFYTEYYFRGMWNEATSSVDYSGPVDESAFFCKFPENESLEADTYTYEATTVDGDTLSLELNYPGEITMPVVNASTITYEWLSDGSMKINWQNPEEMFDYLVVVLLDQNWDSLIYVRLQGSSEELTIPGEMTDAITSQMNPDSARLYIQTRNRVNTSDGNNYARGYSDTIDISWGENPQPEELISFDGGYVQFRSVENYSDLYRGWLGFTENGQPVEEEDISRIILKTNDGTAIPITTFFYTESSYSASWNDTTKDFDYYGLFTDSAFSIGLDDGVSLDSGTYTYEATTSTGGVLSLDREFPQKIVMPYVEASSIGYAWQSDGSLFVNWTNPEGSFDQLRLILYDQYWNTLLYLKMPSSVEEMTIPAEWISDMTALRGPGSAKIEIQTRNYTSGGNNYARGCSDTINISWGAWPLIEVGAQANGFMHVTESDTTLYTGMDIYIEDYNGYAYSQGTRSAIITGPGLPSSGLIYQLMFPDSEFSRYEPSGIYGSFYPIADDEDVALIPDNAEYTFILCEESAADIYAGIATCTELYTTVAVSGKAPVLNANLTPDYFVSLTTPDTHDLSFLNNNGPNTFSWTIPSGFRMDEALLIWGSNNLSADLTPAATSVTHDTTGLPSPSGWAGVFISVEDAYDRWFNMGWSFN